MANQGSTIYIIYFDQIDQQRVQGVMAVCSNLIVQKKPDQLYFMFSSGGGQVHAGITLYNFLRSLPVEIVMHNVGSIDSVATIVFLSGDKRYAAPHSSFLFHGVATQFIQGTNLNVAQMNERRSSLQQDQNRIAGIIVDRTEIEKKEIDSLFRQGESKNLDFAKSKGVIHDILDPNIPQGADFLTINFSSKS